MKRIKITKKITHYFEYLFLIFAGTVFRILPKKLIYFTVKVFALIAFDLLRFRRNVTMENLRNALENVYTPAELIKIARSAYYNVGVTFAEMLFIPDKKEDILAIMDNETPDILTLALSSEKGVIIVSAHFGSWEITGAYISALGFKSSAVVKKQANPHADKLINRKREKFGTRVLSHKTGMRTIIGELRTGGAICLISDQNAGRYGVFVDFFGRKASTPKGAAQLAIKFGVPIIVVMCYRTSPGRYACIAERVPITTDDTVESLIQKYTTIMEKVIAMHPEQYFWMHRRWKTPSSDSRKIETGIKNPEAKL